MDTILEVGSVNSNKKELLIIYITALLSMAFFYLIPVQIPFLLSQEGLSNSMIGFAISISTLAGALSAAFYSRIKAKASYSQIYALAWFCMALGYSFIAFSPSLGFRMAGLALAGIGTGWFMPNGSLWLIDLSKDHNRGSLLGILTSVIFIGQFISPLISEAIRKSTSLPTTFFLAAGSMLILSILMLFLPSEGFVLKKKVNQ